MTKYYKYAFSTDGDKTAVPNPTQVDGSVSYQDGFTADYELQLGSDPDAKPIPRDQTNELFFDLTDNVKQYQEHGVPEFISTSDNSGVAFPYTIDAFVRYNNSGIKVYQSLADSNSAIPTDTTKWGLRDFSAGKMVMDNSTFEGTVVNANVVYFNTGSSNFQKAVANGTAAQNALGLADVTNGRLMMSGQCALVSGLTPGSVYYLSTGTPGAISTTPSSVQIGTAITATLLLISIQFHPAGTLISSVIPSGSAVNLLNGVDTNITSISVPPGIWNIYGNIFGSFNGGGHALEFWTSVTSATRPDQSLFSVVTTDAFDVSNFGAPTPFMRQTFTVTTTVYLSARADFGGSATTCDGCGGIYAEKVVH